MGKKRRRKSSAAAAPAAGDDAAAAGVASEASAAVVDAAVVASETAADSAAKKKAKPTAGAAATAGGGGGGGGGGGAAAAAPAAGDAEEAERVANQRKLQKMVIRMRARGKSEKEIRKAKIAFKREVNLKKRIANPTTTPRADPKQKKMTKREQHVAEWKERNQPEAAIKGKKHNLVIVPVLWRHKEEESSDILAACATIKKYLSSFGLDVWIDERTKYTPGQKFAYWEHLGLKLRVEIGAQEMAKSCCTLSVSTVAGQVARRIPGLPWDGHELIKQVQANGQFKWLRI